MKPTHLLTDLGGVLLTNGWDRNLRTKVATEFGLDAAQMHERHHLTYDTYESGKIDISTYFRRIIFYEPRPYSEQMVLDYILKQAQPFTETIELVKELKARHGLKVGVISNEGKEIGEDRVHRFRLYEFIDFFVISGCVGLRKPDADIFKLALNIAQIQPGQAAYLEDRFMFYELATSLGMRAVWHKDAATTRAKLAELGLD
jgi:putative hydrolase of the HAD superfamily